jgi:stress-induced morphogen
VAAPSFGAAAAVVIRNRRIETHWRIVAMPMDAREIESMIKAAIPDAEVTIRDLAGDGDHYAATVISESFRGKSRVQQHQIVYQSLQGQMGGVLHALALQTGVPD